MADASFWDDQSTAQKVIAEVNGLRGIVDKMSELTAAQDDAQVTLDLAAEENDMDMFAEANVLSAKQSQVIEKFELELMLAGPYDKNNAILELHPGAGGTESQDWALIMLRMYTRWAEDRGFKVETVDYLPGDEAGLKSVTLLIKGHNVYGYLKAEKGVHRLVRISPFDSSGRRHTSFASVDVIPEINDDIDIDIRPDDLKIDVYRSSGAGGQHVNTTDSAVRMTHLPTGLVVHCQDEKSQIKNRAKALRILRARIFELEEDKKNAERSAERRSQIGSGDRSERIRTYNFPQNRVTDHRIDLTLYKLDLFMQGDIGDIVQGLILRAREDALKAESR